MSSVSELSLKDFVKDSLVQITNGVREAQMATNFENRSLIAPKVRRRQSRSEQFETTTTTEEAREDLLQLVEFDVAVSVTSSKSVDMQGKGNVTGKIYVMSAEVDIDAKSHRETTGNTVSRIKFAVPVSFHGKDLTITKSTVVNTEE